MKGEPVDKLVYSYMFPKAKSSDPQSFHALLQRSLIPEVRQETHSFYGHLDTQEAKYPGLDYTHATHRIRLSRWPWHRRLFRAFDALRLTDSEIAALTKWEGTRWAKEKYEREQGITIRDTTADDFPDWVEPEEWARAPETQQTGSATAGLEVQDDDDDMGGDDSDEELESVGIELNERLRAQAARRDAGDTDAVLDEEWEQWLKNVMEMGDLRFVPDQTPSDVAGQFTGLGLGSADLPEELFPRRMLMAARAGQWSEIPEFLHSMLRRTVAAQNADRSRGEASAPAERAARATQEPMSSGARWRRLMEDPSRSPWARRTYSDLRLPAGQSGARPSGSRPSGSRQPAAGAGGT